MISFTAPTRANVKLKAVASGPTGSGKTRGLLDLATGLTNGGRIGLINTEIDGTAFQVDRFKWEQYDFFPEGREGYDPRRLDQAIQDVQGGRLDCLICDSLSLFWDGPGGMLDIKDAQTGKNKFANWGPVTKMGKALMDSIMHADLHILLSLRAERKFKEVDDPRNPGQKMVADQGWRPVFRYKHLFDPHVIWMLNGPEEEREGIAPCHSFWYFKDRIGLGEQFPKDGFLTADFGKRIAAHLDAAKSAPTTTHTAPAIFHAVSGKPAPSIGVKGSWHLTCANEALVLLECAGIDTPCTIKAQAAPYIHNGKPLTVKQNGKDVPVFAAEQWEIVEGSK